METITAEKKTGLQWLWLSITIIVLDQAAKYLAASYLLYHQSIYLLPVLNLTLAHNTGSAFGFMREMGQVAIWFFIATALIVSIVLCIWLQRLPSKNKWLRIALALILGGAIGNLLDRIFWGYVIDFIHFHVGNRSWPIFNLADTAITIGAFMLIIDIVKKDAKE